MMTNFFRKWSKDHTTLLKGSDVFSPKKHIFAEYVWAQYLCVYFSQKKVLEKGASQSRRTTLKTLWWRFSFWQSVWAIVCFNKILFILGTSQKGTILWALYDGIRIVNWYISRTADSKRNLKDNPSETWHFIQSQKRVKILRRLNEFFFQQVLSRSVIFKSITLDCNNGDHEYAKNKGLGLYSSPLYFTLLRSLYLPDSIYVERQKSASTLSRW